jgi:hypothetical protein
MVVNTFVVSSSICLQPELDLAICTTLGLPVLVSESKEDEPPENEGIPEDEGENLADLEECTNLVESASTADIGEQETDDQCKQRLRKLYYLSVAEATSKAGFPLTRIDGNEAAVLLGEERAAGQATAIAVFVHISDVEGKRFAQHLCRRNAHLVDPGMETLFQCNTADTQSELADHPKVGPIAGDVHLIALVENSWDALLCTSSHLFSSVLWMPFRLEPGCSSLRDILQTLRDSEKQPNVLQLGGNEEHPKLTKSTVLILESDPVSLSVLTSILTESGAFKVISASNENAAVHVMNEFKADNRVIDIMLIDTMVVSSAPSPSHVETGVISRLRQRFRCPPFQQQSIATCARSPPPPAADLLSLMYQTLHFAVHL